jgi:hypothetical protein
MTTDPNLTALQHGATINLDGLQLRATAAQACGRGDMFYAEDGLHTVASATADEIEAVQGPRRFERAACIRVEVVGVSAAFDSAAGFTL